MVKKFSSSHGITIFKLFTYLANFGKYHKIYYVNATGLCDINNKTK
jgi:hypothetical protein